MMFKTIGSTSSKKRDLNGDNENGTNTNHLIPTSPARSPSPTTIDPAASPRLHHNADDSPKDLRSTENLQDIYRSVSNMSNKLEHKLSAKSKASDKENQSGSIIGNPLSFFGHYNADPMESRYSSEEEQEMFEQEYHPDPEELEDVESRDEENKPPNGTTNGTANGAHDNNDESRIKTDRQQTFSSLIPSMFRNDSSMHGAGQTNDGKPKRKFQFFRKRGRDRDRKQSTITVPEEDDELDDELDTGERAQNLIGAIIFGAPALSLIASCLLEDETGIARAPLLLSLLGFKITDISNTVLTKNRKFRIDLEYGVGPQRLKWSVEKTAKDLLYLHSRFKLDNWRKEVVRTKNSELPKYPIPPLRSNERGILRQKTKSHLKPHSDMNPRISDVSANDLGDGLLRQGRELFMEDAQSALSIRRLASLRATLTSSTSLSSFDEEVAHSPELLRARINKNQEYIVQVAAYLNDLIKLVALKPQSNRLFHFFEISPISSLLSYETGYMGKQGVIHIGSSAKSQGWRVGHFKANDLKGMIDRRLEKWFLIRNSYVMYVSDINSTLPLEVFLVDHKFKISFKREQHSKEDEESDYDDSSITEKQLAEESDKGSAHLVFKHLKIVIENSERKLTLLPKSKKEQQLWLKSLYEMKNSTVWSRRNRFDSFAPVRDNCYAQWFVDARDYFWAVSSAIEMAKDVVYIHDWWLSPELYLRRPANGNQQWRIDRLLQRKARQGVKIFVIVYRNVGSTVSIDSLYTKHSILSLHDENIHVIRSPNQLLQNTYFWAHHEKLCIVDHTVAFLGGIDLCYGRYDTPDHVLVDDSKVNFAALDKTEVTNEHDFGDFQIFPGKDYSNPRVKDFFSLDKPYESMYDRDTTPRMPWHDVHMLTSGKVARDLSRHFVQRWNYLLRQKRPSRFTPLLTPPSDFTEEEEKRFKLSGSCEVQLLRSSGNWSLGLKEHEQSIQNAYLKLIETSEHFVYIENQFFVTSCEIDGNEIENRIGDALVDRIIRAHNEGTDWRAIIIIPLMPGFESQVDQPDGSSVRVIMQCQYRSISRGQTSIFAKLRKYGIQPEDYIQFCSLRKWGRIGPNRTLVTEQLYIHAKTMIVDDRAAIIGSANINERSMRGVRDSEVAALVRDRETVKTKMGGRDYLAGKFAHSLRIRLMREHLGVHVDIVDVVERRFRRFEEYAASLEGTRAATNTFKNKDNIILSAMVEIASRDILGQKEGTFRWKNFQRLSKSDLEVSNAPMDDIDELEAQDQTPAPISLPLSFNNRTGTHEANRGIRDKKKYSYDTRVQHSETHKKDVYGLGLDKYKSKLAKRARLNSGRFLKDLTQKIMEKNPQATLLPDLEAVVEFLESDDYDMSDEMDEESESIISERNRERWNLLKKVSYLQRVCKLYQDNQEDEFRKREEAGLPPSALFSQYVSSSRDTNDSNEDETEDGKQKVVSTVGATGADPQADLSESTATHTAVPVRDSGSTEYSDNVPIVSLSENAVQSLVSSISPQNSHNFTKFVDPYQFEDPISIEFYEELWYEHARRNTEIFRLVFHTQPDDTVTSWREYKHFSKLQKAFHMSQRQEAKRRKDHRLFGDANLSEEDTDGEEEEEEEEEEAEGSNNFSRKRKSINMTHMKGSEGILGDIPPSVQVNGGDVSKKLSLKFVYHNAIPEDESVSGHHSTENGDYGRLSGDKGNDEANGGVGGSTNSFSRRRHGPTFSARRRVADGDRIFERETAERILNEVQGNLVIFPADWLMRELDGGNWFYNTDRIPPIDIYD